MQTIDDLFRLFGGPARVGRAIGVSTEHAAAMKRRNSIPSSYWRRLVREAEKDAIGGVTLETLAQLAAARRETAA